MYFRYFGVVKIATCMSNDVPVPSAFYLRRLSGNNLQSTVKLTWHVIEPGDSRHQCEYGPSFNSVYKLKAKKLVVLSFLSSPPTKLDPRQ